MVVGVMAVSVVRVAAAVGVIVIRHASIVGGQNAARQLGRRLGGSLLLAGELGVPKRPLGCRVTNNSCVDLDQLVAVPELVHAKQRCRRDVVVKPRRYRLPGIKQVLMLANDVHRELANIAERKVVDTYDRQQVAQADLRLKRRVANTDDCTLCIDRNLTSDKELITHLLGIPVVRS